MGWGNGGTGRRLTRIHVILECFDACFKCFDFRDREHRRCKRIGGRTSFFDLLLLGPLLLHFSLAVLLDGFVPQIWSLRLQSLALGPQGIFEPINADDLEPTNSFRLLDDFNVLLEGFFCANQMGDVFIDGLGVHPAIILDPSLDQVILLAPFECLAEIDPLEFTFCHC